MLYALRLRKVNVQIRRASHEQLAHERAKAIEEN
jgi:hypothetical protein